MRQDKEETTRPEEKIKKVVVYLNSQFLGIGDEALGAILMRSFLKTLLDLETKPSRLILINSGVRLATEGSEVLETLRYVIRERDRNPLLRDLPRLLWVKGEAEGRENFEYV